MGAQRQQELLSALELLGLSASQVIFLSYPDRGTPRSVERSLGYGGALYIALHRRR